MRFECGECVVEKHFSLLELSSLTPPRQLFPMMSLHWVGRDKLVFPRWSPGDPVWEWSSLKHMLLTPICAKTTSGMLSHCEVCGEERPMSTSVMADVHEREFDHVELDFAVELGLHIKTLSPRNFRLDAVGLTFRHGSPASAS